MYGYERLLVWQKADELAYQVYCVTRDFPREEIYGLTSQLRRAALSVPSNIAEGSGRQNKNETRKFANIALGSLAEVTYLLRFARRQLFVDGTEYEKLLALKEETGSLLWRFYKSF
ncbi:MAG: four helix bundle protein [Candidatus Omnitrophica bacterium]|nr:four helix bundle protein [Candidatus Omnitrophota bacterium]